MIYGADAKQLSNRGQEWPSPRGAATGRVLSSPAQKRDDGGSDFRRLRDSHQVASACDGTIFTRSPSCCFKSCPFSGGAAWSSLPWTTRYFCWPAGAHQASRGVAFIAIPWIPAAFGERDGLRTCQALAGSSAGSLGSPSMYFIAARSCGSDAAGSKIVLSAR